MRRYYAEPGNAVTYGQDRCAHAAHDSGVADASFVCAQAAASMCMSLHRDHLRCLLNKVSDAHSLCAGGRCSGHCFSKRLDAGHRWTCGQHTHYNGIRFQVRFESNVVNTEP